MRSITPADADQWRRWLLAAKPSLQVTADHWKAGATKAKGKPAEPETEPKPRRGNAGGNGPANSQAFRGNSDAEKCQKPTKKAPKTLGIGGSIGQAGLSLSPKTLEELSILAAGGNAGGNGAEFDTAELLAIWDQLTASQRAELLAAARALAGNQSDREATI